LNVNHLTSSFITSSQIFTSGSNIFGDASNDTQTLIGTTKMSGSAQVTGSLNTSGIITGDGSGLTNIPASGIVGLNLSQIASGSATASISPDKGLELNSSMTISSGSGIIISGSTPKAAIVISGSNDRTRLHIYDTEDNSSPVYTEGAGIVLTGGEGSAQAILEMSAVGSTNGGSNNEQTFIRSSEMLTITGNSAAAGDNIKLLGSSNYGLRLDAGSSAVSLQYITNGGSTVSTLELGNGTYTKANASGTYYKIGRSSTDWLNLGSTLATFNRHVSSSVISTASFGTYLGDGSNLSGISTTPFPFSGSAIITGSLVVSQSIVDFSNASSVVLPAATQPLINPEVRYFTTTVITGSGTTVPIPGGLTFISSSVYEYMEIFINGLRLRYDIDFIPMSTASVQYTFAVPVGSEITYKSLKRP